MSTELSTSELSTSSVSTSDVVGLTTSAPLLRRGFMTASAAVTAAHTLAAGPVRPHGFHADYLASCRKEAADNGRSRMQAWLTSYEVFV